MDQRINKIFQYHVPKHQRAVIIFSFFLVLLLLSPSLIFASGPRCCFECGGHGNYTATCCTDMNLCTNYGACTISGEGFITCGDIGAGYCGVTAVNCCGLYPNMEGCAGQYPDACAGSNDPCCGDPACGNQPPPPGGGGGGGGGGGDGGDPCPDGQCCK